MPASLRDTVRPLLSLLAGAALLVGFHVIFFPSLSSLRGKGFDLYQMLLPMTSAPEAVVLVTIDDTALEVVGRWPWPRRDIAAAVDAIARGQPRAFGIDILFPETGDAAEDRLLASSIRVAGAVLAMSTGAFAPTASVPQTAGWSIVGLPGKPLPGEPGLLAPAPDFAAAAGGLGVVRATPDPDGVTRSIALVWATGAPDNPSLYPAFSMELARRAVGSSSYTLRYGEAGYDALRTGPVSVPVSGGGAVWLADAAEPVEGIPLLSILDGSRTEELKDRIVILSVSAAGFDSFHTTPLHATRPGAEVHALLTEQILGGLFPFEPASAPWVERGVFVGLALVMAFVPAVFARHLFLVGAAYAAIVLAPAVLGFAAYVFDSAFYDPLQPMAGLLLLAGSETFRLYRQADQRRERITGQFSRYLAPQVVENLIRSGAEVEADAVRREITVLFMDIRGFTAASMALPAKEIELTVNRFFTLASEEIFRTGGTIDKFIGDAVMAFWNAPLDQEDHPNLALDAVERILARLESENEGRAASGREPILVGAGLETGTCSVGNFGSDLRYTYTVIGEAANLAARLETATKTTQHLVLAGPGLKARTGDRLQPAGRIRMQGYREPVETFTLRT